MAGRRKEPVDLILAKGKSHHLTEEEIEKRRSEEVKAKSDCILIPDFVPAYLHERFLFLSEQLQDIGIMSNLDVDSLGRYVLYQHEWERAVEGLQQIAPYKKDGRRLIANDVYYDMLKIVTNLQKSVKQEAGSMGLTISDRCKLVIPKVEKDDKPKETDPFDAMFGGE